MLCVTRYVGRSPITEGDKAGGKEADVAMCRKFRCRAAWDSGRWFRERMEIGGLKTIRSRTRDMREEMADGQRCDGLFSDIGWMQW